MKKTKKKVNNNNNENKNELDEVIEDGGLKKGRRRMPTNKVQ